MKLIKVLALALMLITPLVACTVEQTEEAELPEVDVDVEGGNLPEFDVDAAEIEVGLEDETVTVPTVDVDVDTGSKDVTVKVPDVDIDMPDDELVDDAPDDDGRDS